MVGVSNPMHRWLTRERLVSHSMTCDDIRMTENINKGLFVTGTGTEVGKTYVTSLIAKGLYEAGVRVGVYKPVASGCIWRGDKLFSEDAEKLWLAAGKPKTLDQVTPQRFAAALAPNVAAREEGKEVDADLLRRGLSSWSDSDFVLVEGVGGLLSPISEDELVAVLAVDIDLPLLVVVDNRLGCINQTLLTLNAAEKYGLDVSGIVLNDVTHSADESATSNRSEIERLTDVPVLDHVKYGAECIKAVVH